MPKRKTAAPLPEFNTARDMAVVLINKCRISLHKKGYIRTDKEIADILCTPTPEDASVEAALLATRKPFTLDDVKREVRGILVHGETFAATPGGQK